MSHARWWLAARGVAQLAVVSLWAGAAAAQTTSSPDRALAREILEELVEIPTTEANGATRARAGARRPADRRRLSARRRACHRPEASSRRISWRGYRGTHTGVPALLLMAHIDVVPARREDWSVDPWTFLERDGLVLRPRHQRQQGRRRHARRQLHRLKREGWRPARDIIVAADRRRRNRAGRHPVAADGAPDAHRRRARAQHRFGAASS